MKFQKNLSQKAFRFYFFLFELSLGLSLPYSTNSFYNKIINTFDNTFIYH